MRPTIEDLWNGNLAPGPNCGATDLRAERFTILMDRHKESLEETFSQEQMRIFRKYVACVDEYVRLLSSHAFSDGFCLASKLLSEALSEE